jgi:hypothetical protein
MAAPVLNSTPTIFSSWFCPFAQRVLIAANAKQVSLLLQLHQQQQMATAAGTLAVLVQHVTIRRGNSNCLVVLLRMLQSIATALAVHLCLKCGNGCWAANAATLPT